MDAYREVRDQLMRRIRQRFPAALCACLLAAFVGVFRSLALALVFAPRRAAQGGGDIGKGT